MGTQLLKKICIGKENRIGTVKLKFASNTRIQYSDISTCVSEKSE